MISLSARGYLQARHFDAFPRRSKTLSSLIGYAAASKSETGVSEEQRARGRIVSFGGDDCREEKMEGKYSGRVCRNSQFRAASISGNEKAL